MLTALYQDEIIEEPHRREIIIENIERQILILNGENDSETPVQQAFLLQQRLTEIDHPDHTLITCPNLGHTFYPSSEWSMSIGPIQPYVLTDLYVWLETHSGFTNSTTNSFGQRTQ